MNPEDEHYRPVITGEIEWRVVFWAIALLVLSASIMIGVTYGIIWGVGQLIEATS